MHSSKPLAAHMQGMSVDTAPNSASHTLLARRALWIKAIQKMLMPIIHFVQNVLLSEEECNGGIVSDGT